MFNIFYLLAYISLSMASSFAEYEPNDNYSSLILGYQSSTFANKICIGSDCHEGVGGPSLTFARQVIPNLALGFSGAYLQSTGNSTSIQATNGSLFLQGIVGLGRQVDLGASVAALSTNLQLCSTTPDVCTSTRDTGSDLGVFGKVFLNDKKSLSVGLSYNTIRFQKTSNQSVIGLSFVAIVAQHHRFDLSLDRVRDADGNAVSGGSTFGYSFLVY